MNCVLFVVGPIALDPVEVARVAADSEVTVFDRYFECSDRISMVAESMLTGVYERVHAVARRVPGRRYTGPTLPAVLRRHGFDCIGLTASPAVASTVFEDFETIREGTSVEALDGWFARRADAGRPFFAFVWAGGLGGKVPSLEGLLDMLEARDLRRTTAVVAVATNARDRSVLPTVLPPPPLPLVVVQPSVQGGGGWDDRIVDTVDLRPTVLALTGDTVETDVVGSAQGAPLVAMGGATADRRRTTLFAELADDRLGVRGRIVRGLRSAYAVFDLEPGGPERRFSWSRLAGLARGPVWRRKLLLEILSRGSAERVWGGGDSPAAEGGLGWGRAKLQGWLASCDALAEENECATEDDAVLRARLRGLGYLG